MLLSAVPALASLKISVTVMDTKTGRPVVGLTAADFIVLEEKLPKRIEAVEYVSGVVDVMLLLDTGLDGGVVRPLAEPLVAGLQPKEQMAIVSVHSSSDLIQDFTSSKQLLGRAIGSVQYGNTPRTLDALYAAIDTGFKNSTFRRVIVLLTAGREGDSRTTEQEVVRVARRNAVSIYPVYVLGRERSMFEKLARQTGGATFNLRGTKNEKAESIAARIYETVRGRYDLTVSGNLAIGEKIKVEINREGKFFVSALPE
ncbi:MAG: VWA domain-containing protein [Bryobacteraceae bacterium]